MELLLFRMSLYTAISTGNNGSFNFSDGTNNVTWKGVVFLNGIEQDNIHFVRKIQTAGDVGSTSFTGFINVDSVPIDIDFRVRHDNGGAINVTFVYLNLNVSYEGLPQ